MIDYKNVSKIVNPKIGKERQIKLTDVLSAVLIFVFFRKPITHPMQRLHLLNNKDGPLFDNIMSIFADFLWQFFLRVWILPEETVNNANTCTFNFTAFIVKKDALGSFWLLQTLHGNALLKILINFFFDFKFTLFKTHYY